MRKLIVSIHSTVNNVVTGPPDGDETDFMQWAHPGIDESLEHFAASIAHVDTILLGRGTYEDLVRKWPEVKNWPDASKTTHEVGDRVNTATKYVVTSSLEPGTLHWGEYEPPTVISGSEVEERVQELKESDGGDIVTFGSPVLVRSLTNAGLVDEYQILVHPVVIHEGRRLFDDLTGRTDLELADVTTFPGSAMTVTYRRVGA